MRTLSEDSVHDFNPKVLLPNAYSRVWEPDKCINDRFQFVPFGFSLLRY